MSCGSEPGFASPIGNVEDVQNRYVSEFIASLRSSVVNFEEVWKPLEAILRRVDPEVEHLRSENKSIRIELGRLNLEKMRPEEEKLRKCSRSGNERVVAERPAIAEDVYDVLMERVGRGGGETSLKEIFDELRRENDQLKGEKSELQSQVRVWAKKYEELDQRVLRLECILGAGEEVSQVRREPDGLINVDALGDRGSPQRGHDSKGGGSVSFTRNARKRLDFGAAACLSQSARSSCQSPVKEDGVLQGDGSPPIEIDDYCSGPSKELLGDKYHGGRIDEKGNKELKRKRGSVSSVFYGPTTQTLLGALAAVKQQKNIEGKDSDNSLRKSTGVSPSNHENGANSASAKSDDGSSLQKERWKFEAEMLVDITKDDELCMKAVCALYRRQRSKSMERSTCQGYDGLLSPREISLAEFLTGGDPEGKLKKSVTDLPDHCPNGLNDCRSIAIEHCKQLFIMYQKKEDPFFPSS